MECLCVWEQLPLHLNIKQKECCYMKCSILFKKKRILLVVEVAKIDDTIDWQVKSKPGISVLDIF